MGAKKRKTPWSVLISIVLGIFVGTITGRDGFLFPYFKHGGELFINSLTLIIVPLVSSSIITGVAKIGSEGQFGRIGAKTFGFYFLTKLLAILVGITLINIIKPGIGHPTVVSQLVSPERLVEIQATASIGTSDAFLKMLYDLIPPNILDAFAKGNMLGLIFFSILFGYAITHISKTAGDAHMHFWTGVFEAMINITHYIMKVLPLGVFCLVAKIFAETGLEALSSVGLFFLTVILGLGIFCVVVLPLILQFAARVNPWNQFRAMAPALITAFSTSSSAAALPITLECMEKRAGVSNRICSLVIPLGTSVNLTGSALYEGMAALFIAQSFGIELSLWSQFAFVFITLLTSIGIASVPSGSLVIILILLRMMGIPPEGIGLILAVDRILDMFRSVTNIFTNGCCAVFVARSEGEKNILTKKNYNTV